MLEGSNEEEEEEGIRRLTFPNVMVNVVLLFLMSMNTTKGGC